MRICLRRRGAVGSGFFLEGGFGLRWSAFRGGVGEGDGGCDSAGSGGLGALAALEHGVVASALGGGFDAPVLPLGLWYSVHWHRTGFVFGNPEYLRYNAEATFFPVRVAVAFLHRVDQVSLHMNLFVPVLRLWLVCCCRLCRSGLLNGFHARTDLYFLW